MADEGNAQAEATPARRKMKPILLYEELVLGGASGATPKKYTCVDVCARFLACGASNGSVYIFARSQKKQGNNTVQFRLLKMIAPPSATNDRHLDPVTCLSFCPAQRFLVVGTSKGAVYAISLLDPARIGEKIEFSHPLHHGFSVVTFLWDNNGGRLFSACLGGTVAQTTIRAGVSAIFGSTNTEFLLKEDTSIVQLDIASPSPSRDLLLVSSQTRVLIIDLSAADNNGVIQLGSKLRQGNFGGCFYVDPEDKQHKVFSTRPGKRVWVGDPTTGTVSSTLRFSMGVPPTLFFQGPNLQPGEEISMKNLNLSNVHLFKYIHESMDFTPELPQVLSWSPNSSALFLIDPIGVEVVEWHIDLGTIHDLKVLDASVFAVLHGDPCRVAIIRACAAVEFLELAVSNDLQKSIELAVKYSIHDLSLLLNLQCKWTEHIKEHPEDTDKISSEQLTELEALIDSAATLVQEHTRPPELDIAPPHVVFKQRKETSLGDAATSQPTAETLSLKINFFHEKPALYESARVANGDIIDITTTIAKRAVTISDLTATDKVVDEAWRATHLPPRSDVQLKAPTLFGEVDLETHLTNATSQLVSFLPERYFGKLSSNVEPEEEAEFPPFDEEDEHPTATSADPTIQSILRLAMAVDQTDDLRLIVPESQENSEDVFNPRSDQEVVLEAIAQDLYESELQFQSKRSLAQKLHLEEDTPPAPRPLSPKPVQRTKRLLADKPLQKRPRSLSETKKQLIQRTVSKQIGVIPASHVQQKWFLHGTMQESAELQVVVSRPFDEVFSEFQKMVHAATSQLNLWPSAKLTRYAGCLVNAYINDGRLEDALSCLKEYLNCFDPTIDIALIQKRKQIEQIKKNKMAEQAIQVEDEDLPLTRSDWNCVRLLVSFYFIQLGPVDVETLTCSSPYTIPEFHVGYRLHFGKSGASEDDMKDFLTKYGNYMNLDWAAQICSVMEYPRALEIILNLAVASESLATECEDILNNVAEGKAITFPPLSSLCVSLHLLHVLLKKRTTQTIEWCIQVYPNITPWNVQWALFGASVTFDPKNATYLTYLTTLFQRHPNAGVHSYLMNQWLTMHFEHEQEEDVLLEFLRQPKIYILDHQHVTSLCLRHGKWRSVLQLVLNSLAHEVTRATGIQELRKMIYSMLQSEVQLTTLNCMFQDLMLLEDAEILFGCILEEIETYLQDAGDSDHDKSTYIGILHALFDACGLEMGLKLVKICPTLISITPLQLYQALTQMKSIEKEHKVHITHMLEDIDTYIWSCSRSHHLGFGPQVEAMFRIECGYYNHWTPKPMDEPFDGNISQGEAGLCQFFESRGNDWGGEIQLHDWNCIHCDLPLVYIGEDERNIDFILLGCGHAYHDVCLPDRTCTICLEENFSFD